MRVAHLGDPLSARLHAAALGAAAEASDDRHLVVTDLASLAGDVDLVHVHGLVFLGSPLAALFARLRGKRCFDMPGERFLLAQRVVFLAEYGHGCQQSAIGPGAGHYSCWPPALTGPEA